MSPAAFATLALVTTALLAGCGADRVDDPAATSEPRPAVSRPAGTSLPLYSIEDALEAAPDAWMSVVGVLVGVGDDVRLCSALAESHPPQCAGPSLRVEGDPFALFGEDEISSAGGVRWIGVTGVTGSVRDGTLHVSHPEPES